MVAAAIRTIFAKPDAEHVREQLDTVAAMLGRQLSRLLFVFGDLDDREPDLESAEQKSVTATAADDTWTPQQTRRSAQSTCTRAGGSWPPISAPPGRAFPPGRGKARSGQTHAGASGILLAAWFAAPKCKWGLVTEP